MSEASSSSAPFRPVILIVGAGSLPKDGLGQALSRQGIHVETASVDFAREAVVRAAPDLVVLAGDATGDAGITVLDRLGASQMSSVVPAVVLGEALTVDERLAAFRHGATAAVSRSPSMVATAVRVAGFLREIPDRTRQTFETLGEPALRDFADEMSEQFRAKLLARQFSRSDPGVRLVFGGGRALVKLVDEFIQRRGGKS
jgi:DNA-binding response OmpR family regulator